MNTHNIFKLIAKNAAQTLYKPSNIPYQHHNINNRKNELGKWRSLKIREIMEHIMRVHIMKVRLFDEKKFFAVIGRSFKIEEYQKIILEKRYQIEKSMNVTLDLLGKKYFYYSNELIKFHPELNRIINGSVVKIKKPTLDTLKHSVNEVLESNEYFLAKKYGKLAIQHTIKAAGKLFDFVQKEMKKPKKTTAKKV